MNIRPHSVSSMPARQQGAATLVVVLILLLGMMLMALTALRVGVNEQRITGNDNRAREAHEAAEAAVEHAVGWANDHEITTSLSCPGDNTCPTLETKTNTSSGETYTISALTFAKGSSLIKVTATVQGTDTNITATTEAYMQATNVLTLNGSKSPPVMMNGCLSGAAANPADIFPNWHDINGDNIRDNNEWNDLNGNGNVDTGEWSDLNGNQLVDNEIGASLATSKPSTVSGTFCLDYCSGANCRNPTGQQQTLLHNGLLLNNVPLPNNSLWDFYFNIDQLTFQGTATGALGTAGGLYWISSANDWGGSVYGTADHPVIVVFDKVCPRPTNNTTVYGLLYFLQTNCAMNAWGNNLRLYGAIVVDGNITGMRNNLEIHGVGDGKPDGVSEMPSINSKPLDAIRIPGTWRDF